MGDDAVLKNDRENGAILLGGVMQNTRNRLDGISITNETGWMRMAKILCQIE